MTDLEGLPSDIRAEVLEARAAKDRAEREMKQTMVKREREYAPRWERINLRRIANSLGEEYTLSLTPRLGGAPGTMGATPKRGAPR